MRTTWVPGDIIDVVAVPKRCHDPEARLFEQGRPWILVTSGAGLENRALWGAPPDPRPAWQWSTYYGTPPSLEPVAFVCVEAIRERLSAVWWERQSCRTFFVQRTTVLDAGFVEGPIVGSARYRLRDIAAAFELASDGSVLDDEGRHTGVRV